MKASSIADTEPPSDERENTLSHASPQEQAASTPPTTVHRNFVSPKRPGTASTRHPVRKHLQPLTPQDCTTPETSMIEQELTMTSNPPPRPPLHRQDEQGQTANSQRCIAILTCARPTHAACAEHHNPSRKHHQPHHGHQRDVCPSVGPQPSATLPPPTLSHHRQHPAGVLPHQQHSKT